MKNATENNDAKSRRLSEESAKLALSAFEKRFGKKHVLLACHAALPLLLTPELINLIRLNFTEYLDIPWIAEADILLSPLCMPMGDGAYEMEPGIRELLLKRLEALFGRQRLERVANFLLVWLKQRHSAKVRAETAESHRWIAMAYVDPSELIDEWEERLSDGRERFHGMGIHRIERIRMRNLARIVSKPMLESAEEERFRKLWEDLEPASPGAGKKPFSGGSAGPSRGDMVEVSVGKGQTPMKFLFVPTGEFMMGSPESEKGRYPDEGSLHKVVLKQGFFMQTTPVTVGQWRSFAERSKYRSEAEEKGGAYGWTKKGYEKNEKIFWDNPGFEQTDEHPVTCLSWNDAKAFASWLNDNEDAAGEFALPSEAQWEYACRAGTTTRYYSGDEEKDLDRAGWYDKNSEGRTHPVGEKEPNKFGLYDMHGNVYEWCEDDWHDNYEGAPEDGSAWVDEPMGSGRVVRGGSWSGSAGHCRAAIRSVNVPSDRYGNFGFRLVFLPGRQAS